MASKKLSLAAAFIVGSELKERISSGLGALRRDDRYLVRQADRNMIRDSLDLDLSTRDAHPNAHRWDYLLSIPDTQEIVGLEPHSARDSEVSVVIAKRRNAIDFLVNHFDTKHKVARWVWVTHGTVGFSKMERAQRLLNQHGISFEGRVLKIRT